MRSMRLAATLLATASGAAFAVFVTSALRAEPPPPPPERATSRAGDAEDDAKDDAKADGRTVIDLEKPTLVTLRLKDEALASAFDKLSEQSGTGYRTRLVYTKAGEQFEPVTLDADGVPYLDAFARLCAATVTEPSDEVPRDHGPDVWKSSSLRADWGPEFQRDGEVSWMAGPASDHGPFRAVARSMTRSTHQSIDPAMINRSLMADFRLMTEPRVRLVSVVPWVQVTEAVDENGLALTRPGGGGQIHWPPPLSQPGPYLSVSLNWPDGVGRRLAVLKGTVHLRAVSASRTIEVNGLGGADGKPVEGTAEGARYSVAGPVAKGEEGGHEVNVTVARAEGEDDAAWNARKVLVRVASRFRAYDADGRLLPHFGTQHDDAEPKEVRFKLSYGRQIIDAAGTKAGGPPVRIAWEMPLEVKELAIPLEFKDLPLP